jgi:DNA repair exonuclease SbcCD nuclease subunit
MKIAIITDTHFGARGDRQALLDNFVSFYRDCFFPHLMREDIKTVWHLGDLVDRRKFINFNTLDTMKNEFLDRFEALGIELHMLMGNHDQYYKNKVSPNALEELLGEYENIKTYCYPCEVEDQDICVIPWICDETKEDAYRLLKESKRRFCFGHLQIKNYEMDIGRIADEGEDKSQFETFDKVLTGHFHHKNSKDNIFYLGSPYEMTWRDYKDPKGFHVFDLETGDLEFIENPYKMFHKLIYDDSEVHLQDLLEDIDARQLYNTFVKIVIINKTNNFWFDSFLERLNEKNVGDIQIVEDHHNLNMDSDDGILEQAEDTLTILNKYIDSSDFNVDKVKLQGLIKDLYDEAALIRV